MIGDLLIAFLIWLEGTLAASGLPLECYEEEKMAIRHLPGTETEARIVWAGDGPWLAATFLRSEPFSLPAFSGVAPYN